MLKAERLLLSETTPERAASGSSRREDALTTERQNARLRAVVDKHFALVWRSLRRLGVPVCHVDDAAQQVFLVASRRMGEIELGGERNYLLGIAVRVASESRRTLARRREVPEGEARDAFEQSATPTLTPEELVDRKRARELLDEMLANMPDDLRDAFVLFELEGMAAHEIAALLGIPIGTVASRVRRAREVFQKRVRRMTARERAEGGCDG